MPQIAVDASSIGAHLATGDVVFSDRVTEPASALLRDPSLRWLVSNEPPNRADALAPPLVAVTRTGARAIVSSLLLTNGVLSPRPSDVFGSVAAQHAARPTPVDSSTGVAYSAADGLRGVYFVGGAAPSSMTVIDPVGGFSREVRLTGASPPQQVQSVTVNYADEALYVLDRDGMNRVHLLRVDLSSGVVRRLGSWRDPLQDRWSVAAAWDGSLVVARSSGRIVGATILSWIEPRGSAPSLLGTTVRRGVLLGDLGVDGRGVSLALQTFGRVSNEGITFASMRSEGATRCQFDD